jgi:hypothetical protein
MTKIIFLCVTENKQEIFLQGFNHLNYRQMKFNESAYTYYPIWITSS